MREILQQSGKVIAVFQGHKHEGDYNKIEDIHYYTLKGMIEGPAPDSSAYAIVEIKPSREIIVTGYRRVVSSVLPL